MYDQVDRIKEEISNAGSVKSYYYDLRGSRKLAGGLPTLAQATGTFTYDVNNRLKSFSETGQSATYTYYPDGMRASKKTSGTITDETHYVYVNGQLIEELDGSSRVRARNLWGGTDLIWRKDYTSDKSGYYYYNTHGDVITIKDFAGTVLNSYKYDIWGNVEESKETMSNPFLYAGETYDKETGFYYLRARYYDPAVGRLITEDSVKGQVDNPLTLNRYTYTHNNPLRYVDPTGNVIDTIADIGFVAYDTYQLVSNPSWENAGYLALDVAATIVPFATGAGAAARGATAATKGATTVTKKAAAETAETLAKKRANELKTLPRKNSRQLLPSQLTEKRLKLIMQIVASYQTRSILRCKNECLIQVKRNGEYQTVPNLMLATKHCWMVRK
ncbi:RHS repeat-associated core domain-containing protein [Brevibacillus dissolubilis]|uniref:RHS repeat-associated core domain-containing protein n=1 Tax=Brevibacillus dissolubilis TaxID=1844116 RepID=UPI001116426B|nr:RHS repeat-associated core domain-containing protein [Brevibacillus dissolubilis]